MGALGRDWPPDPAAWSNTHRRIYSLARQRHLEEAAENYDYWNKWMARCSKSYFTLRALNIIFACYGDRNDFESI